MLISIGRLSMIEKRKGSFYFMRGSQPVCIIAACPITPEAKEQARLKALSLLSEEFPSYRWRLKYSTTEHFDYEAGDARVRFRCIGIRKHHDRQRQDS